MSHRPRPAEADAAVDRLTTVVRTWPGVRPTPHRFSSTAFVFGPREVGHVHRTGAVDIHFPRRIRESLLAEGRVEEHRFAPESGWTTFHVSTPADEREACNLLRLSYLYHALCLRDRPVGRGALREVDVDDELRAVGAGPEVRAAFAALRG
jgi:ribosomal protein L30/L7E